MLVLVVLDGADDAGGRTATAMGLAGALARTDETVVRLFLTGEAARAAIAGSNDGGERVPGLRGLIAAGVDVRAVCPCLSDGHVAEDDLLTGVEVSTLGGLAAWTLEADRVLVF